MMTSDEWFVTEEELANWMQQRTRSHPMTTNPKPMLTRKQVAAFVDMECDCTDPRCKFEEAACRTIEAMAKLLAERCDDLIGLEWCGERGKFCEPCQRKRDLLSTFSATGGDWS